MEYLGPCHAWSLSPLTHCRRGFSLVEMLAVVFVVGIIATLVTLNVSSGSVDRELEREVQALRSTAAYALDEAQFSGADFGLLFVEESTANGNSLLAVHWRQRLPSGWREPLQSTDVFVPLVFPSSVTHQLLIEGIDILTEDPAALLPGAGVTPQWLLFSSGETQPGELIFRDRDSGEILWRLSWDLLGRFELFRGDDERSESAQQDLAIGAARA